MQEIIVALIVLVAAWTVARKYLPASVRHRSAAIAARTVRGLGLVTIAAWLEVELPVGSSCADGCKSCGSCGPGASAVGKTTFAVSVASLKRSRRR